MAVTVMLHRDNSWFINGGEKTDRRDEWAIWRKYVTSLTVEYLESLGQNNMKVEVLIYIFVHFIL